MCGVCDTNVEGECPVCCPIGGICNKSEYYQENMLNNSLFLSKVPNAFTGAIDEDDDEDDDPSLQQDSSPTAPHTEIDTKPDLSKLQAGSITTAPDTPTRIQEKKKVAAAPSSINVTVPSASTNSVHIINDSSPFVQIIVVGEAAQKMVPEVIAKTLLFEPTQNLRSVNIRYGENMSVQSYYQDFGGILGLPTIKEERSVASSGSGSLTDSEDGVVLVEATDDPEEEHPVVSSMLDLGSDSNEGATRSQSVSDQDCAVADSEPGSDRQLELCPLLSNPAYDNVVEFLELPKKPRTIPVLKSRASGLSGSARRKQSITTVRTSNFVRTRELFKAKENPHNEILIRICPATHAPKKYLKSGKALKREI